MSRPEQWLALAVLLGPVLCCIALARSAPPGRMAAAGAVVVVVLALIWDRHKAPYEGPAIIVLGRNGLTVVDLVVPVSLAVAGAVLWRFWRR